MREKVPERDVFYSIKHVFTTIENHVNKFFQKLSKDDKVQNE